MSVKQDTDGTEIVVADGRTLVRIKSSVSFAKAAGVTSTGDGPEVVHYTDARGAPRTVTLSFSVQFDLRGA